MIIPFIDKRLPWWGIHPHRSEVLAAVTLAMGSGDPLPQALARLSAGDPLLRPWSDRLGGELESGRSLADVLRRHRLLTVQEARILASVPDQVSELDRLSRDCLAQVSGTTLLSWMPVWVAVVASVVPAGYTALLAAMGPAGSRFMDLVSGLSVGQAVNGPWWSHAQGWRTWPVIQSLDQGSSLPPWQGMSGIGNWLIAVFHTVFHARDDGGSAFDIGHILTQAWIVVLLAMIVVFILGACWNVRRIPWLILALAPVLVMAIQIDGPLPLWSWPLMAAMLPILIWAMLAWGREIPWARSPLHSWCRDDALLKDLSLLVVAAKRGVDEPVAKQAWNRWWQATHVRFSADQRSQIRREATIAGRLQALGIPVAPDGLDRYQHLINDHRAELLQHGRSTTTAGLAGLGGLMCVLGMAAFLWPMVQGLTFGEDASAYLFLLQCTTTLEGGLMIVVGSTVLITGLLSHWWPLPVWVPGSSRSVPGLPCLAAMIDAGLPAAPALRSILPLVPGHWVRPLSNAVQQVDQGTDLIDALIHNRLVPPRRSKLLAAADRLGHRALASELRSITGNSTVNRNPIRFHRGLFTILLGLTLILSFCLIPHLRVITSELLPPGGEALPLGLGWCAWIHDHPMLTLLIGVMTWLVLVWWGQHRWCQEGRDRRGEILLRGVAGGWDEVRLGRLLDLTPSGPGFAALARAAGWNCDDPTELARQMDRIRWQRTRQLAMSEPFAQLLWPVVMGAIPLSICAGFFQLLISIMRSIGGE